MDPIAAGVGFLLGVLNDWLDYFEHVTRVPSEGLVGIEHEAGLRLKLANGLIRRAA
jgi:hypothetical protein